MSDFFQIPTVPLLILKLSESPGNGKRIAAAASLTSGRNRWLLGIVLSAQCAGVLKGLLYKGVGRGGFAVGAPRRQNLSVPS